MKKLLFLASLCVAITARAQGLRAEYFPNQTFLNTPFVRIDPSINFDWGNGSPAFGIVSDHFSVRWTGEIDPQFEEVYTFHTGSDDGVRVWLNGRRIISNWQPHILATNTATVFLKARHRYRLQVDFYDNTAGAVASLGWSSARQPFQIIPTARLFTPVANSNRPPNIPLVLAPPIDGDGVDADTFVMRTEPFSDPDSANVHLATEWEIWADDFSERLWVAQTTGNMLTHVRLSDGVFENSFLGRTTLRQGRQYLLRVKHQDNSNTGDGAWSDPAERVFNTYAPLTTLVMQGAVWKYNDSGLNEGTGWRGNAYSDAGWLSGPAQLGVGDGDENTITCCAAAPRVTTYFRHQFVITNFETLTNFVVRLLRDDGGVVYVNGTEVFRDNMPAGTPGFTTLAPASATEAEESWLFRTGAVNRATLHNGTNLIAAEIHQSSTTSTDLTFDLELLATRLEQSLALRIERGFTDDCLTLSWGNAHAVLESAPTPQGPWTEVPGNPTSPFTNCDTGENVFYRLMK